MGERFQMDIPTTAEHSSDAHRSTVPSSLLLSTDGLRKQDSPAVLSQKAVPPTQSQPRSANRYRQRAQSNPQPMVTRVVNTDVESHTQQIGEHTALGPLSKYGSATSSASEKKAYFDRRFWFNPDTMQWEARTTPGFLAVDLAQETLRRREQQLKMMGDQGIPNQLERHTSSTSLATSQTSTSTQRKVHFNPNRDSGRGPHKPTSTPRSPASPLPRSALKGSRRPTIGSSSTISERRHRSQGHQVEAINDANEPKGADVNKISSSIAHTQMHDKFDMIKEVKLQQHQPVFKPHPVHTPLSQGRQPQQWAPNALQYPDSEPKRNIRTRLWDVLHHTTPNRTSDERSRDSSYDTYIFSSTFAEKSEHRITPTTWTLYGIQIVFWLIIIATFLYTACHPHPRIAIDCYELRQQMGFNFTALSEEILKQALNYTTGIKPMNSDQNSTSPDTQPAKTKADVKAFTDQIALSLFSFPASDVILPSNIAIPLSPRPSDMVDVCALRPVDKALPFFDSFVDRWLYLSIGVALCGLLKVIVFANCRRIIAKSGPLGKWTFIIRLAYSTIGCVGMCALVALATGGIAALNAGEAKASTKWRMRSDSSILEGY